ncbi:protein of unknown function [Methylococcus capsulatus]|uniref:Uncharacterized protein n=1 Tax=Methylococcus capsulatus TaxID=414 RepID=A0AA35UCN9_METCP|nr:protein of unknown function [Methylococcus capsulatus]
MFPTGDESPRQKPSVDRNRMCHIRNIWWHKYCFTLMSEETERPDGPFVFSVSVRKGCRDGGSTGRLLPS